MDHKQTHWIRLKDDQDSIEADEIKHEIVEPNTCVIVRGQHDLNLGGEGAVIEVNRIFSLSKQNQGSYKDVR